jgi:HlyD family secretion protein
MSKRNVIITVAVVVVVGVIAVVWTGARRARSAMVEGFQTAQVETGSLVATVGATGTVRSNQTVVLGWQTTGTVEDVLVEIGDQVAGGEDLAELVQTSLPQNVILAQAELVNAQDQLDALFDSYSELSLAAAAQQVAQIQKSVERAERLVNNLNSTADELTIEQARANVALAENQLEKAQERYGPYENKPEDNLVRAALLNQLAQAQATYDAAVRTLNALEGTTNETDIALADADYALAQQQLIQAQEDLERLVAGPTDDEIAAAQARIAAVQATLNLAHIQAPFAGTVTQAIPRRGDQVSPGLKAFRVDDLSRLLVDVQVSEIDINRIQNGQEVVLTFDAILAKEYAGKVVEVGFVGTNQQGIVSFEVTIELLDADELVKPGMTAAVNIVVSQIENALLVPNRAVRVLDGERVVYRLVEGDRLEPVTITLGASSEMVSEVLESELQVGDVIVLNPPVQFEPGPPGGRGGMFGGGGG